MKIYKKTIVIISLLLLFNSAANADKFVMTDGSVINGSIISETSTSYLLRAEVTRNVYSEKTVLKSSVAEIRKTDKSIAAYKKLTSILPTRDLMTEQEYETVIRTKVEPFISKYPSSQHIKDAEEILKTLRNEHYTVKAGGIKLGGKLLTAEQVEADKYNLQVAKEYHQFTSYVSKKYYRSALTALQSLEERYPHSTLTRKAQKIGLSVLPRYQAQLQKIYDGHNTLVEKRARALDAMTGSERTRTKRLFEQKELQYQKQLNAIKNSRQRNQWLPINPYYKKPIEHNLKMIQSEIRRIAAESEKPTVDVGRIYADTHAALVNGDYTVAKEHFDKFKHSRPPEEFLSELEPRLAEARAVMIEAEKQQRAEEVIARKKEALERKKRALLEQEARAREEANKPKEAPLNKIQKRLRDIEKLSQ